MMKGRRVKKPAPTLFGRLLASSSSLLVYGPAPTGKILPSLIRRFGAITPVDVRVPEELSDAGTLRREVQARLEENGVLVFYLGGVVPPHVRGILKELCVDPHRWGPSRPRVIAFSPRWPDPDVADLFPLSMAAASALRPRVADRRISCAA